MHGAALLARQGLLVSVGVAVSAQAVAAAMQAGAAGTMARHMPQSASRIRCCDSLQCQPVQLKLVG